MEGSRKKERKLRETVKRREKGSYEGREREIERDLEEMEMERESPKRRWKKREEKRSTCLFVTVSSFFPFSVLKSKLQMKTTELVRPKVLILYRRFYFRTLFLSFLLVDY